MSALLIPQRELFINGNWVQPVRGMYLDVVNPATEGARVWGGRARGAKGGRATDRGQRARNHPEHQQQLKQTRPGSSPCPHGCCCPGVIGRIPAGTVEDVEAAVAAAVAAHKTASWARSTGKQRAVVLRAIAEKVCL